MAIETTQTLTDSVRARYTSDYLDAAMFERLYDQLSQPMPGIPPGDAIRSSATLGVYLPFLSDMNLGVTEISETVDITPQVLEDVTTNIVWTSRAEGLQCSEKILISAYTNYGSKKFATLGKNQSESIDLLAMAQAVGGNWVESAGRSSINAGSNDATDALFAEAQSDLLSQKVPGIKFDGGQVWPAILNPYVFHDIREGGNVDAIGLYQDMGIHLNFELGQIGPFRFVVSPWAKTFYGAAANNGTDFDTTLASAATKLDKTITLTTTTNAAVGKWLNIVDAVETGTVLYPQNERVKFVSATSAVCDIIGEGANGGLRFDHATTGAVNNNDSAYTIVFGGPQTLIKLYAPTVGPFGMVVGPTKRGVAEQFVDLAWKFYGGYGLVAENRLLRYEVSVSYEA